MSCVFSTQSPQAVPCDQPQLTINFPVAPTAGNTVTLVNGAIVDLDELGRIIAKFCPGVLEQAVPAAPVGTGQTVSTNVFVIQV